MNSDCLPSKVLKDISNYTGKRLTNELCLEVEDNVTKIWYDTGLNDYSYYDSEEYLYVGYNCYRRFSRNYVKLSYNALSEENIGSVLDFGAGIGASTFLIYRLFDNAVVYYQNLSNTLQFKFAREVMLRNINVKFIDNISQLDDIDLIFALDLFEHIKDPIRLLQQMINLNPKFIVTSNSFLVKNYGHHEIFEVESNLISKKNISKIFRDTMINNKYKIDGRCNKFWNRRPVIWSKV